ncbi:solute-binding protein [Zafaria cholistanensis]|uniref:Solute-binding protein n=1 Tax=Zafaria cholistanensis TaxID=1682741 RepID=A0A5A7NLQ7_9MICC|nr:substrate-binding domain-containing protein [Zafaria cholistanensis]GER21884.1 solute-binding protein [Zafaria cholistanensis]
MRKHIKRIAVVAMGAALAAGTLAGCGNGGGDGSGGEAVKVGLLLPETKAARYEAFDRPMFEEKLKSLGNYEVVYSNADQDAAKQQQQAESALAAGIKVLVLDPVDAASAGGIVSSAAAQDVPVISYDRLIAGGGLGYYVSFDNEKVGMLQGSALVEELASRGKADGRILMINGSPTDSNAAQFKKGAHSAIDASDVRVIGEFDTPDWSPDKAQSWAEGQISQHGGDIDGVYAANDGTAGGAVAALKAANADPWPVVTGQDAELSAIQRIVAGDQFMTVYKAIKPEAERAAVVADQLARGEAPQGDTTVEGTPSTLLEPVVVTRENIMDTVVADGFWTVDQICTAQYKAACTEAGIR